MSSSLFQNKQNTIHSAESSLIVYQAIIFNITHHLRPKLLACLGPKAGHPEIETNQMCGNTSTITTTALPSKSGNAILYIIES